MRISEPETDTMNDTDTKQEPTFCSSLQEPRNTTPPTPLPPPGGPSPIKPGPGAQVRLYRREDYSIISDWWIGHGVEAWPESLVTSVGCVVEWEGAMVAAGWLYLVEHSHLAFFHGLVTAPGLTRRMAREAITALVDGLDIVMKSCGRTLLLGTVPEGAMLRSARSMGFAPIGEPMQQVVRVIQN